MKCIIPLWGYATRLFPLTENYPKALITINNRPILDYILDKVLDIGITEIYLVTNSRYYEHFLDWKDRKLSDFKKKWLLDIELKLLDDGTDSNETRLGTIWDIDFVVQAENLNDDLLIICGDNMFKFDLGWAYSLFQNTNQTVNIWYDIWELYKASSFGVINIDDDGKAKSFEEKPQNPKSSIISAWVYFYPKEIYIWLSNYLKEWKKLWEDMFRKYKDAPWNLLAWLNLQWIDIRIQTETQDWFDIGTFENLEKAKEAF